MKLEKKLEELEHIYYNKVKNLDVSDDEKVYFIGVFRDELDKQYLNAAEKNYTNAFDKACNKVYDMKQYEFNFE